MQSQLGGNQHIFGLKQAFTADELFVGIQDLIHWFQWFVMVVHHWFNDGMVAYHRRSLTRLDRAVPGPWRGRRIIFTCARQGWSNNSSLYLSIISMSKSITTLLTFLPRVSFSESSSPSSFYLKPSLNPNAAVSITIVARSRAHCRNLLSTVIVALFFRVLGVCQ